MRFIDFVLLAAILAAAVSVIVYMRRRRKKGECGCDSSSACEGCPMAGSCNDKKKQGDE
jgi:hypothetical protein